ncbi:MAG: hypothetical protein JO131_05655 [Gammaproteobacteria bacterium]|nr:hypothetical protein [Gammaproteobacteria bacterium]
MNYKVFIFIVVLNILSTAYAFDKTTVSFPAIAPTLAKQTINVSSSGVPDKAVNSADPYQICFTISTWVVPPQTLLSYLYNNATVTPASDQTVWVTANYNQGYFSGQSYTAINNSILSQKYLIGSVTTEGKVYITFYSGTSTSTDLVTGIGTLNVNSAGQCTFTMQMNSGQNGVSGLIHWSYMVPVKPGDPYYNNLPGTNMSVPQFLAQF